MENFPRRVAPCSDVVGESIYKFHHMSFCLSCLCMRNMCVCAEHRSQLWPHLLHMLLLHCSPFLRHCRSRILPRWSHRALKILSCRRHPTVEELITFLATNSFKAFENEMLRFAGPCAAANIYASSPMCSTSDYNSNRLLKLFPKKGEGVFLIQRKCKMPSKSRLTVEITWFDDCHLFNYFYLFSFMKPICFSENCFKLDFFSGKLGVPWRNKNDWS